MIKIHSRKELKDLLDFYEELKNQEKDRRTAISKLYEYYIMDLFHKQRGHHTPK